MEYDRRLHSIENTASSLLDVLRSLPQQQQTSVQQQYQSLSNLGSLSIAQSNDSYSHDPAQEDLRSSPRWSNPMAQPSSNYEEPQGLSAPPGFFRNPRINNPDDESSASESVPDQPSMVLTGNNFDLRPTPSEYLDSDHPVAWESLEGPGVGSAWEIGGDLDLNNSRFQYDWSARPGSVDLQDKYNWPVCADDEVDTIVSLLVNFTDSSDFCWCLTLFYWQY